MPGQGPLPQLGGPLQRRAGGPPRTFPGHAAGAPDRHPGPVGGLLPRRAGAGRGGDPILTRWPVANPWSAPVYYLPSTRSTMEDAQRLLEEGCPTGTVVAAGFQEGGRGRCPGRSWEADAGRNLLFTLVLELQAGFPPQRLPVL